MVGWIVLFGAPAFMALIMGLIVWLA